MTNLEWINEQIEECDEMIEHLNIKKDKYSKNKSLVETYKKHIKNLTGVKQYFEQIEAKLIVLEILKDRLFDYEGVELQKRWYDGEENYHYFLVFNENFEIELVDENQYNAIKECWR